MSTRKRAKANKHLYKRNWKLSSGVFQRLMKWFLRSLLVIGRRTRLSTRSGFVLPTVVMVSLVVILLTTALLVRSFDRSKNASNVRVNQAVLNAATPALDRARAKIDEVFKDPTLPRETPSDESLYNALASNRYVFGDETRLKLVNDIDGGGIKPDSQANTLEQREKLTTAWKFPVDTDNNGLFDSYTLYGIYFRSPTRGADGKFNRARNPLEARTPPMDQRDVSGQCADKLGTSDSVGDSDWYQSGNKLTKSFFVYTANVPITDINNLNRNQYEQYKGNRGFSALELQQDRVRIPFNNNAVWYEDDIEVTNATTIRINGRVVTNSNLLVAGNDTINKTIFYQVSDPDSCYYEQENSKIVVGGNIANGDVGSTIDQGHVEVHRFQGKGTAPAGQDNTDQGISYRNKTIIPTGGRWVGYNNNAYSERIGLMVQAALNLHFPRDKPYPTPTSVSQVVRYPQEVKERFTQRFNDHNETKEQLQILIEELETYFKAHTRRVPYAEVPSSTGSVTALGNYTVGNVFGSIIDVIRPPDTWMEIDEPTSGITTGYTNLPLKFGSPLDVDSGTMYLQATEPTKQQKDGKEYLIGDRVVVGNNLPFFWPKYTTNGISNNLFAQYADQQEEQIIKNGSSPVYWTDPDNGKATNIQRTRQSQLQMLPDLGSVERDAFWEIAAAKGGLRVVTGAGIYFVDEVETNSGNTEERTTYSFLPRLRSLNEGIPNPPKFETTTFTTNNDNIIVWPDSMPMRDNETPRGDLQMRATAVYHYKQGSVTTGSGEVDLNQIPIACVSSYYDPTDEQTARNFNDLPDVSGIYDRSIDRTNGQSNNGVTYIEPYKDDIGRISAVNTYRDKLNRQARAIFPNGRIVNEPLRNALNKIDARDENRPRSLSDNAAIDTAICALKILDQTLSVQPNPDVPHGAIKEVAFLDSRQVKSLHNLGLDNTKIAETSADLTDDKYTLPLEQRQPLEIRATEIDLELLKNSREIGTPTNNINNDPNNDQEYLLPNSGIIYATRDDSLPDSSDSSTEPKTRELVSLTDFKLDSTRRPNAIRLINGSNIARKNFYRVAEKGLILATNLPTYIKGDFNLHKDPNPSSSTLREEFQDELEQSEWDDFYTRDNTPDLNFACRQYQPGCADSGDQWRPATIISDGQTLLSTNFLDGFRNQGDYDLNNNQGNSAVDARLKNGFWNNNFVTSANWTDSNGYPSYKTSYLTNGVTPIQRRVDNFPEYVMEICRKLPVSQCQPKDWVIGYDADGNGTLSEEELKKQGVDILGNSASPTNPTTPSPSPTPSPSSTPSPSASQPPINKPPAGALVSGTTASPAGNLTEATGTGRIPTARPENQRYARRIAFKRDENGALVLKDWKGKPTPIPIGINAVGKIDEFPYDTYGAKAPKRAAGKSLWFRTTTNTSGQPDNDNDASYTNDKPLAYTSDTQLFSPPTPDIPALASLKLPVENPAYKYTICTIAGGSSKDYNVKRLEGRNCGAEPGNPLAAIQATLKDLLALDPNSSSTDNVVEPKQNGTFADGTVITFTNNPPSPPQAGYVVNVVDLNSVNQISINEKQAKRIQLKGDGNSIFVFKKASGSLNFGSPSCGTTCSTRKGVVIDLNGVDPNNVFWALNGSPLWNEVAPNDNHKMQGTFIINGNVTSFKNVDIEGGRLLGLNSFPGDTNPTAIASTGQPYVVPVLQIHSPTGTPGNSPFDGSLQNNWLQKATTTTANAAFITGDSPSRPNPSESGGGLYNLVRFLENWSGKTARISGSFIQYRRSAYSSAPFNPVDPTVTDASASLFYTLNSSNQTRYKDSSDTGFRYRGGTPDHRASFYMPPIPAYSFDVAILSQSPDFFAQKFTMNTSSPTEYFREVGRDDSWVQTLLCAAQGTGYSYTYAVDSSERPSNCPSLTLYNDQ